MAISEQIELLGKGLYKNNIPDRLTLESIPTLSELEYISAEDFDRTMIENILPKAVKEDIDFKQLLEIDYQWVLRALRILNYGPYYTTNTIFCDNCGKAVYGDHRVNLNAVECKPLPKNFDNKIIIDADEFIDYNGNVEFHMPTIQEALSAYNDPMFKTPDGRINRELARICYMVTALGAENNLSPVEVKLKLEKEFTSADYLILKSTVQELTDYGIRAGGSTICPKCGNKEATFIALIDDRYFRPTVGDLRTWKTTRSRG